MIDFQKRARLIKINISKKFNHYFRIHIETFLLLKTLNINLEMPNFSLFRYK